MPLNWGKFNSSEKGWVQCMKAMEECVIKADITREYGLAFMLNPLVKGGACAKQVLDKLLVVHKKIFTTIC